MAARNHQPVRLNKVLPRVEAPIDRGLTREQARERLENGYGNTKPDSAERTIGQIFRDNIFTYLNLVLIVLALCVVYTLQFIQLTFLFVVIINTFIGIIQELRSRRALNKLSFIAAPHATVIRDGERMTVPAEGTVLDDIAIFGAGQQIYADAIVLWGECNVNEALVTGEAEEIIKSAGNALLSGSFVVSGECVARLDKVGRDSFVAQLTLEAKKTRGRAAIGMVAALKRLVQIIGIVLIPVGVAMVIRSMIQPGSVLNDSILKTVGALIGIVPDGLYLLVSTTLTVSVLRLAQRKTLVQERDCVETLARVDVLCVDKTGTITENDMEVKGTVLLDNRGCTYDELNSLIADYVGNMPSENETMAAVQSYIAATPPRRRALKIMQFSSAVKYGGVTFGSNESYLLGAPERILLSNYHMYRNAIDPHSANGYRVLLLARYGGDLGQKLDENRVQPLGLILLSNRIRKQAPGTFQFFARQGVKIIVISGDNPMTVSHIAREAGIEGAERFIDATELTTERQIKRAVGEYIVFGRVTPDQKRKLVRALKATGHTVAMTGDGVNDVLALKDANCSIAMASGSEVASQVADIVLLDSDFSSMPAVVMEGRRVINNIERSAALFLTKNAFSFLLAIIVTIILARDFPFEPAKLTLFNVMLIGVPSFILALEPNKSIVRGRFMVNVVKAALPAGLTDFIMLFILIMTYETMGVHEYAVSTMALYIVGFIGFLFLAKISYPFNALRIALIIAMLLGFTLGSAILGNLLGLVGLYRQEIWITVGLCAGSLPVFLLLTLIFGGFKKARPNPSLPRHQNSNP